ncbi:uncharacterized protein A4U43_C07F18070 [Asparagus officinalis]|uniref:Uncharacterized protein n=1 Tax=Asparagus officinalis TaxID=4686 RepID=A0A5P1EFV6_ASPOF|nr:uncharacterized protein A4U43_C07F18070 [Asparagus officinalis]
MKNLFLRCDAVANHHPKFLPPTSFLAPPPPRSSTPFSPSAATPPNPSPFYLPLSSPLTSPPPPLPLLLNTTTIVSAPASSSAAEAAAAASLPSSSSWNFRADAQNFTSSLLSRVARRRKGDAVPGLRLAYFGPPGIDEGGARVSRSTSEFRRGEYNLTLSCCFFEALKGLISPRREFKFKERAQGPNFFLQEQRQYSSVAARVNVKLSLPDDGSYQLSRGRFQCATPLGEGPLGRLWRGNGCLFCRTVPQDVQLAIWAWRMLNDQVALLLWADFESRGHHPEHASIRARVG